MFVRFTSAILLVEEILHQLEQEEFIRDSIRCIVIKRNPMNLFSQRYLSGILDFDDIIGFYDTDSAVSATKPADYSDIRIIKQEWTNLLLKMKKHLEYLRGTLVESL